MLTHRNELLVWITLASWRHIFLKQFSLQRLVIVIYLSDCSVVIFVSGTDSVPWLLTSDLINSGWLSVVNFQLTFSSVPIHEETVLVLAAALEDLLGSGDQPVAIPDVILV